MKNPVFSPVLWPHAIGYLFGVLLGAGGTHYLKDQSALVCILASLVAYFGSKYLAMLVDNG